MLKINCMITKTLKMDNRKEGLRIGHSRLTHKHLANEDPPECIPCNTPLGTDD